MDLRTRQRAEIHLRGSGTEGPMRYWNSMGPGVPRWIYGRVSGRKSSERKWYGRAHAVLE